MLLLFRTLWQLVVLLTNLFECLTLLRILPPYWKFASQNYQAVAQATGAYQAPPWIPKLLFLGVLIWQSGALILFGERSFPPRHRRMLLSPVNETFTASLGLPAVFMIADEGFQQYEVERAHVLFFRRSVKRLPR